jgi:hypothetical protein
VGAHGDDAHDAVREVDASRQPVVVALDPEHHEVSSDEACPGVFSQHPLRPVPRSHPCCGQPQRQCRASIRMRLRERLDQMPADDSHPSGPPCDGAPVRSQYGNSMHRCPLMGKHAATFVCACRYEQVVDCRSRRTSAPRKTAASRSNSAGVRRFHARETGDRMRPVPDAAKISTINRACGL